MSKKKRKNKPKRPTQSRRKTQPVKAGADFKAIKTMGVGALCVAAFIAFFVFKVNGLSLYDRLTQETPTEVSSTSTSSSAKPK